MGLYDSEGKRLRKSVNLTPFQQQKLNHICQLFGLTHQRFFTDSIEFFYCQMIEVQSGRITFHHAMKESMLSLLDEIIKLREMKGLVPKTTPHLLRSKDQHRL